MKANMVKMKGRYLESIEHAIPGFGFSGPTEQAVERSQDPDPTRTFAITSAQLRAFLSGRDSVAFLARTGLHLISQMAKDPSSASNEGLQQPSAELLQTIALTLPRGPELPTSPRNMVRGWNLAERNIHAYAGLAMSSDPSLGAAARVSWQARIQTLYYRNIDACGNKSVAAIAALATSTSGTIITTAKSFTPANSRHRRDASYDFAPPPRPHRSALGDFITAGHRVRTFARNLKNRRLPNPWDRYIKNEGSN